MEALVEHLEHEGRGDRLAEQGPGGDQGGELGGVEDDRNGAGDPHPSDQQHQPKGQGGDQEQVVQGRQARHDQSFSATVLGNTVST